LYIKRRFNIEVFMLVSTINIARVIVPQNVPITRQGCYRDGQSALLRKLKRYREYFGAERRLCDWEWFDEFRVIVAVKNEVRKENLSPNIMIEERNEPKYFLKKTALNPIALKARKAFKI
jgi:hypothetical protein